MGVDPAGVAVGRRGLWRRRDDDAGQPDDFLPPEWRTGTPFRSWVLPGIALLLANGIVPTITLVGAARRSSWTALAHVAVGSVLIGWIVVQLLVIGFLAPAFQLGYLTLGLIILGLLELTRLTQPDHAKAH